jgi:hypothetical protein
VNADASARLDIVPIWRTVNDMLIELVDTVPDDRMDWSPKPDMWAFSGCSSTYATPARSG